MHLFVFFPSGMSGVGCRFSGVYVLMMLCENIQEYVKQNTALGTQHTGRLLLNTGGVGIGVWRPGVFGGRACQCSLNEPVPLVRSWDYVIAGGGPLSHQKKEQSAPGPDLPRPEH